MLFKEQLRYYIFLYIQIFFYSRKSVALIYIYSKFMNMKIIYPIYLFSLIFIFSCSTQTPKIEGLDYGKWINDTYGCAGEREKLVHLVNDNKEMFLRFNQNQMIDIFGRPENQTLYSRGQTIFYYFIKYNPECGGDDVRSEDAQMKLEIRFDALNRSKEVYIHNL